MIVGEIASRTTSHLLAAQLSGTRLRVLRPRLPAGALLGGLASVSCVAPSRCMAVGGYHDPKINSSGTDLAEVWNGTAWRMKSTPHPKDETALLSVSCASAATCLAAGWPVAGIGRPLALTLLWAAGRWKSLKTTGSSSLFYEPQAVSCDSPSACVTAGFVNGGHGGLAAEKWNGRALRFMLVSTRSPGQLFGISCPLPTRCIAVGGYARQSAATRDGGIAELWNGTRWRSLPVASP